MRPIHTNPYARASHGHFPVPSDSNHLNLPRSSLPLNKASCDWLDSMSPAHLGVLIKDSISRSPQTLRKL
jgi:hypothetical protein